ncbi:DUF6958 family protein [Altererythrobacter sp. GH1-8]|uniref:DUF6958 family protein n=1 Tax=Altererythrobacter sp. GH1-8 TaxID=3349333 RepID=UPI00374CDCEC
MRTKTNTENADELDDRMSSMIEVENVNTPGKTSGWWAKTVQLDLEAKGKLVREETKPLRWHFK